MESFEEVWTALEGCDIFGGEEGERKIRAKICWL